MSAPDLFARLLQRLGQQGVSPGEASFFMRDLSKILEAEPGIDPASATSRLNLLGWNGVSLDYQSLQLAIACVESEHSKQGPARRTRSALTES